MRDNRPPDCEDTLDAIWDYLNVSARTHGQGRTAERFGVSRQTLWRLLERDQVGRRLPRAVLDTVGDSVEALEAATRTLSAQPLSRSQPLPTRSLSDGLRDALFHLCEAPLATARELSRLNRIPVATLRDQLVKLAGRGLVDSRPHRLEVLGPRPYRRYFPTAAGIRAVGLDETRQLPLYPVSKQWFKAPGRAARRRRRVLPRRHDDRRGRPRTAAACGSTTTARVPTTRCSRSPDGRSVGAPVPRGRC